MRICINFDRISLTTQIFANRLSSIGLSFTSTLIEPMHRFVIQVDTDDTTTINSAECIFLENQELIDLRDLIAQQIQVPNHITNCWVLPDQGVLFMGDRTPEHLEHMRDSIQQLFHYPIRYNPRFVDGFVTFFAEKDVVLQVPEFNQRMALLKPLARLGVTC